SRVHSSDTFLKRGTGAYEMAPEEGRHGYDQLLHDLAEDGRLPDRIAHFWLVTDRETFRPGESFFDRNMAHGLMSLTHLAQAMGNAEMPDHVHLCVFTTGAAQVRDEALPYPEKACIAGPLGVIPHEMPGITCASVDIELPERGRKRLFGRAADEAEDVLTPRVLEEILSEPGNSIAAWRGDRRFGQSWKPAPMQEDAPVFRDGGTYLITGGFGGIGQVLARDLMERHGANVVLMGREALPAREDRENYLARHAPSDRVAQRIRAVEALEALGKGRVMTVSADVCNITQMRAAVAQAEEAFGAITGVIHAAGRIDDGPILTRNDAEIGEVLAPKVTGLQVLDQVFPDGMIEVMVLFSSSSTATRPAGQVDYVAANEYLNAWARSRVNAATRVVAVNWGVWADAGMAAEAMAARLVGSQPSDRTPAAPPILDEGGFDTEGNRVSVPTLRTEERWVLDEHRTAAGEALMPGTGYVELAAEALQAHGIEGPFAIRDLYFFRPLWTGAAAREMVVRLESLREGFTFSVHSAV
ncbi:SDR family oxidoreductase, partial [Cribrihabitans sp. XS_ASV171]